MMLCDVMPEVKGQDDSFLFQVFTCWTCWDMFTLTSYYYYFSPWICHLSWYKMYKAKWENNWVHIAINTRSFSLLTSILTLWHDMTWHHMVSSVCWLQGSVATASIGSTWGSVGGVEMSSTCSESGSGSVTTTATCWHTESNVVWTGLLKMFTDSHWTWASHYYYHLCRKQIYRTHNYVHTYKII